MEFRVLSVLALLCVASALPKAISDASKDDTRFSTGGRSGNPQGGENIDTTFFVETDLRAGKKMTLLFTKTTIAADCEKSPQICKRFSVKANSPVAKTIKSTVQTRETPNTAGEDGYLASSLQSVVDFSVSKLGKNVKVLSTEDPKEAKKQEYSITAVRKINSEKGVVCHKLNRPNAAFYCHELHGAGTYMVPLEAADGTKVNAIAACHTDASVADAFKLLKVKPGSVPVCHFLASDTLVWVPN